MFNNIKYDKTYVLDFVGWESNRAWLIKRPWFDKKLYAEIDSDNVRPVLPLVGSKNFWQDMAYSITNHSRLYIMGHGAAGQNIIKLTKINSYVSSEKLAYIIACLLKQNSVFKINNLEANLTISLIVCSAATGTICPANSFAAKLQTTLKRKYGLWVNILARTRTVFTLGGGGKRTIPPGLENTYFTLYKKVRAGEISVDHLYKHCNHKKPESKLMFKWLPDGKQQIIDAYAYAETRFFKLQIIDFLIKIKYTMPEGYHAGIDKGLEIIRKNSAWDLIYVQEIMDPFLAWLLRSSLLGVYLIVIKFMLDYSIKTPEPLRSILFKY